MIKITNYKHNITKMNKLPESVSGAELRCLARASERKDLDLYTDSIVDKLYESVWHTAKDGQKTSYTWKVSTKYPNQTLMGWEARAYRLYMKLEFPGPAPPPSDNDGLAYFVADIKARVEKKFTDVKLVIDPLQDGGWSLTIDWS